MKEMRLRPGKEGVTSRCRTRNNGNNSFCGNWKKRLSLAFKEERWQILVMCHSCVEIDKKIEHYRRLQKSITDQLTIDTINKLISGLSSQKDSLHPDRDGSPGFERR
jgi:hypothetical protein